MKARILTWLAILGASMTACIDTFAQDARPSPAEPQSGPREWRISDDLQVRVLKPGIWLHTSWRTYPNGSRFLSHGLIVEEGDHLLLIDTAWGEKPTEELLSWIEQELRRPVTQVIVTHAHEDRMGGAPVLVRHGIRVLADAKTGPLAKKQGWPAPASIGDLSPGESVEVGMVEVFYPGPGHTADNTVVWIPSERVLFGGCAVKAAESRTLGNTADADVAGWPEAIRRIQRQYEKAEIVVPAHGAVGGPELLEHTLGLLAQSSE